MYLEKKSHKIYYKDSGDKNLPVIIFIHGFPLDHTMWDHSIKSFHDQYRTVSYDIRGLGKSTLPEGAYTFEFLVDDLQDIMNHLDIDKAILAGLSMGGYIALRAAERNSQKAKAMVNGQKSEKFSALILCDTQARNDHNPAILGRYHNIRILTEQGIDVFAEKFLHSLLSQKTIEKNPGVADHFLSCVKKNSIIGITSSLVALATRTSTVDYLSQIDIPVLLIAGEKDSLTPPELMKEMAARIQNSSLKIIPDAGHMSAMENPEEFSRIVSDFLRDNHL